MLSLSLSLKPKPKRFFPELKPKPKPLNPSLSQTLKVHNSITIRARVDFFFGGYSWDYEDQFKKEFVVLAFFVLEISIATPIKSLINR